MIPPRIAYRREYSAIRAATVSIFIDVDELALNDTQYQISAANSRLCRINSRILRRDSIASAE
jgi:hypothetical protein